MEIIGFDTETFKGKVKVLCNSKGKYIENADTYSLLDWLYTNSVDIKNGYNVFYNINYDLFVILKNYITLNYNDVKKQYKEGIKHTFKIKDITVDYISGKGFKIIKKGKTRHFYDTANFYTTKHGFLSLETASAKYLSEHKNNEELGLDRKKIGSETGYYEKNRDLIIKYCIQDCILTAKLTQKTLDGLKNLNLPIPETLYSMASVHRWYMGDKGSRAYTNTYYKDIPLSIRDFIEKTYKGGIFKTDKIGYYENTYNLDINSAYPSEMINLYDIKGSKLINIREKSFKDCDYKFYQVKMLLNPDIPYKTKLGVRYAYSKEPETIYITQFDKDYFDLYGFKYDIIDGYGFITKKHRLFSYIKNFYDKKKEIKEIYGSDSVEYNLIKLFLNSGYGILAQSKPEINEYFTNFVYASYITAYCRRYIMSLKYYIEHNKGKVLAINTDGILFQIEDINNMLDKLGKDIPYTDKIGKELNELDFSAYKSAVLFESGVYLLEDMEGKYISKTRGYPSFDLSTLKNVEKEIFDLKTTKIMKLNESIIQDTVDEIGNFFVKNKIFSPYKTYLISRNYEPIKHIKIKSLFESQITLKYRIY